MAFNIIVKSNEESGLTAHGMEITIDCQAHFEGDCGV